MKLKMKKIEEMTEKEKSLKYSSLIVFLFNEFMKEKNREEIIDNFIDDEDDDQVENSQEEWRGAPDFGGFVIVLDYTPPHNTFKTCKESIASLTPVKPPFSLVDTIKPLKTRYREPESLWGGS